MIKNKKKGFTIVELVIVIAVIGILSAVLIPVFSGLVAKANLANDNALVKNINTQLAASEIDDGKNMTMYDALQDAKEAGYLVANINARSNNQLVWDSTIDRFALIDQDGNVVSGEIKATKDYQLWKISNTVDANYSTYYIGNQTTINTSKGFDAGEKKNITAINYANDGAAQNVVIRTNGEGTTLTVNAPNDTIHHYDFLDGLTVTAVANASYHEHGTVRGKAVVSQGHIEVASGANVPQIVVENVPQGKTVKVTANAGTTITVDSAANQQATVVANTNNVYVDGVESTAISGSAATTVKMPELIMNETQLRAANNGFAKLGANIEIATDEAILVAQKCVLDLNGYNITFADNIGDETDLYHVGANGDLTVRGNGKIVANSRMIYVEGALRVEGGKFVTTVVTNGANDHSTIIAADNSSVVINNGEFYSAKCALTTFGELVINGGKFVSIASTKLSVKNTNYSAAYSYTLRIENGATINGGSVYGIHGAIAVDGGDIVINNVYAETSTEALTMYGEVQDTIHNIGTETPITVSTLNETSFLGTTYYPLYAAGEYGVVSTTVNGGEFVNKGSQVAAHIGNSSLGDGGKRLNATVKFNGGKFVAENNANIIAVDYYVGTIQISGGNFNKNQVKNGHGSPATIALTEASKIIADGYKVVAETDGTWSVVKK